jgi:hypothetical protein
MPTIDFCGHVQVRRRIPSGTGQAGPAGDEDVVHFHRGFPSGQRLVGEDLNLKQVLREDGRRGGDHHCDAIRGGTPIASPFTDQK